MRTRREWEEYCVGEPSSNPKWVNVDCSPLESFSHICHVSDAYRIFEDRRIRSSLIWDESKLRNTRTCVAWLSPNTWVNGSIYGNIRFQFDWRELIEDKKFYWVEVMKYGTHAYRILITKGEPRLDLERYRPEKDKGPLYYDSASDKWYCNGNYTGEFMLDEDLWLRDCKTVTFENHHDGICTKDRTRCEDLGLEGSAAGAKLISRLIGQNVLAEGLRRLFLEKGSFHKHGERAWGNIVRSFNRIEATGRLRHEDEAASSLMTAMLDRYGTKRKIKALGALFRSSEELELTLRTRAARAFGIRVENVTGSDHEDS